MPITPFYAALLAPIFILLASRVIGFRIRLKVAIGDGGNPEFARAIRAHANFAEHVPFALLMVYFLEVSGGPAWAIHILLIALVAARSLHAWGISQVDENFRFRTIGAATTFMVMGFSAMGLAALYLLKLAG
jgi:uncharacterized membrane protein YecN with MAPEG domain